MRLLVIEDDPRLADALSRGLGQGRLRPWEVRLARTLREAEEILGRESVDVALVDLGLPDAAGTDSVDLVMQAAPRAAVIVLTGRDDEHTAIRLLQRGIQEYLVKGEVKLRGIERTITHARERFAAVRRLEAQARRDPLTGLANAFAIRGRLATALERARRQGRIVGVAFMDLDGFKAVNDDYGHLAGDAALISVGARLRAILRATDSLGRVGGDEFVAVLEELGTVHQGMTVARKLAEALRAPFRAGKHQITLSASIGLAAFPQHGATVNTLLDRADAAMYAAKQDGDRRVRLAAAVA